MLKCIGQGVLPKDLSFPPSSPCMCLCTCMHVCVCGGGGGGVHACVHACTCSVGMLISGGKLQLWAHIKQISDLLV